jgi:hypothetical protein
MPAGECRHGSTTGNLCAGQHAPRTPLPSRYPRQGQARYPINKPLINNGYLPETKYFAALHKKIVDFNFLVHIIQAMMHCNMTLQAAPGFFREVFREA